MTSQSPNKGPDSGTMVGSLPCNPPSIVAVNGDVDLSTIITGKGGACVKTFVHQPHSGPARNAQVYVYGQGPQGSGGLRLDFSTANGPHDLTISSADPDCHNDVYSDGAPSPRSSGSPSADRQRMARRADEDVRPAFVRSRRRG